MVRNRAGGEYLLQRKPQHDGLSSAPDFLMLRAPIIMHSEADTSDVHESEPALPMIREPDKMHKISDMSVHGYVTPGLELC